MDLLTEWSLWLRDGCLEAIGFRRQRRHARRGLRFRRSVRFYRHDRVRFGADAGTSDIDFEYPSNDDQATGYASLLAELRTAFNQLASRKGDTVPYTISVRGSSSISP